MKLHLLGYFDMEVGMIITSQIVVVPQSGGSGSRGSNNAFSEQIGYSLV